MNDIKIPQAEEFFDKLKVENNGTESIRVEFLGRIVTIIIAGLALITALAWDEVLHEAFNRFKDRLSGVDEKLAYAIFVTLFSIIVSIIIGRIFIKKKIDNKKKR